MQLGAFSISLAVKDLQVSKDFYRKLGFDDFGGADEHGFAIMKSGSTVIGLFQGMFEDNILTFNPGWTSDAQPFDPFDDVRDIKAKLKAAGIDVHQEQGGDEGPASFLVPDPDGNAILIDQHR